MKIVSLRAEGYKRLTTVEITPEGNVITIGGNNGAGKSSVLDAIWAALKGRAVNPPKPVHAGCEKAIINLDLGDLVITRTFTDKGDGKPYTDTVKVENAEGLRYSSPQAVLDGLLGGIAIDPFEFMNLKPDAQAERLLALVPLPIDLDEHAELDNSDYEKRREVNRDIQAKEGQLAGIPKEDLPEEIPDREALVAKLGNASQHNLEIEREQMRRQNIEAANQRAGERALEIQSTMESLTAELERLGAESRARSEELKGLPALEAPIDVQELQEEIRQAENLAGKKARQESRQRIEQELTTLREQSEGYTKAMADREREREEALSKAKMPVPGLGFTINEKGKPIVTYEGLPFDKDQISTAAALRVSTAIAMAANPGLRVLQIRDGSLLDQDSLAAIAEMAKAEEYQIWIERVGTEGVGIIIENGEVKGAGDAAAN